MSLASDFGDTIKLLFGRRPVGSTSPANQVSGGGPVITSKGSGSTTTTRPVMPSGSVVPAIPNSGLDRVTTGTALTNINPGGPVRLTQDINPGGPIHYYSGTPLTSSPGYYYGRNINA